jgi:PQQ-dependent catabolism-associated CXXCW motif protein
MPAVLALLFFLLVPVATIAADPPPIEPEGYRLDNYLSTPPLTVEGRLALNTKEAQQVWEGRGAIFIDVLTAPRRPEGLPASAVWAPQPRLDIPGGVWLPDVGRGALSSEREAWFRARLERVTGGDRAVALVFYCRANCWMSWNATKRALGWGYTNAQWYRDGTDGWQSAGFPVAKAEPPEDMPN